MDWPAAALLVVVLVSVFASVFASDFDAVYISKLSAKETRYISPIINTYLNILVLLQLIETKYFIFKRFDLSYN